MPLVLGVVSLVSALTSVGQHEPGVLPEKQVQASQQSEIVVVGRRLEQARYAMKVNRETGESRCWITFSSGDEVLDKQFCTVVEQCARLGEADRVQTCVRKRKEDLIWGRISQAVP